MRRDAMARKRPSCQSPSAMDRTPVIAVREAGVLTLILNRPQRLNAMSNALIEAMNAELARARDEVWAGRLQREVQEHGT